MLNTFPFSWLEINKNNRYSLYFYNKEISIRYRMTILYDVIVLFNCLSTPIVLLVTPVNIGIYLVNIL